MKRILTIILSILLIPSTFIACSPISGDSTIHKDYDIEKVNSTMIASTNGFAFDIFRKLNEEDAAESIFISPLSISAALTMTYNGAETTTKEAMGKVLGFEGMQRDLVNESYKNLLSFLENADKDVALSIANSIWYREDLTIPEDFQNNNKDTFNAEIEAMDFTKEATLDTINEWISKATKGKIEKMLEPPIDPQVIMYLINAIYFKGDWTTPFDPKSTYDSIFTALDGTKQPIKMMNRYDTIEYASGDDYKAVRLPYGSGKTSMIAILPDEHMDINTFIEKMQPQDYDAIRSNLKETKDVTLKFPKFKLEYGIKELNDSLKALGMEEAFSSSADFSGILPGIYISEVLHKAVIEVNEEGSEAAAVTVVIMEETAAMDPITFIADRPFIFFITDDTTGTILFMGKLVSHK